MKKLTLLIAMLIAIGGCSKTKVAWGKANPRGAFKPERKKETIMKIILEKVGAFKKASNKKAVTKDSLVEKVANRITGTRDVSKLAIVNSISQESGNTVRTLTGRYGSRALFTVQVPEGVSESEFRASVKESVLASESLRNQVWEMYQTFSQTNSLNAQAGGQA